MGFNDFNESLKSVRLDNILDKISKGDKLSEYDKFILDNYDDIMDEELMDYTMITAQKTYESLSFLISRGLKVICNLSDRNGKINSIIEDYYSDNGEYFIILKNGMELKLDDNKLFNIENIGNGYYSLFLYDEYYEKIPIDK